LIANQSNQYPEERQNQSKVQKTKLIQSEKNQKSSISQLLFPYPSKAKKKPTNPKKD
jgi:hypothetical protein